MFWEEQRVSDSGGRVNRGGFPCEGVDVWDGEEQRVSDSGGRVNRGWSSEGG